MTARIAVKGAEQHAVDNAPTEPFSRLGAAGWMQGKIKDNVAAGLTADTNLLGGNGRYQYLASTACMAVLDSDGNSFNSYLSVLDSDGNAFSITKAVLDSDGNSFTVN